MTPPARGPHRRATTVETPTKIGATVNSITDLSIASEPGAPVVVQHHRRPGEPELALA